MRAAFVTASLLVVFGAGCIDPLQGASEAPGASAAFAPWGVEALDGCIEAGFIAPYNIDEVGKTIAGKFERSDITEELNSPAFVSTGVTTGPITGNWHQGFQCKTAVLNGEPVDDFKWGYVGQWVEAPAWDPGGADVHVHLTGFGIQAGPIRDALLSGTTMDVTETLDATLTYSADGVASIYMVDATKGTYQVHGALEAYRDLPERVVRLWWYVPTDGTMSAMGHVHPEDIPNPTAEPDHGGHDMDEKTFHPVWVDVRMGAGEQQLSHDAVAAASHTQEGAHGGLFFYLPEMAATYEHEALSLELGKVVTSVVLDEYYAH